MTSTGRSVIAWITSSFRADTTLGSMLGKDSSGFPAVFSYHYKDVDENVPFPHITVARFGNAIDYDKFTAVPDLAVTMDNMRIAVCVWSRQDVDEAWIIYGVADQLLRGPNALPFKNNYFNGYRVDRTQVRDDLFDTETKSYHLHSEYKMRVQYTGLTQPA